MDTDPLIALIVAHCFFACPHTVSGFDPDYVHDRMERHYRQSHDGDLARMGYPELAAKP